MDPADPLLELFFSPGTIHPSGHMLVSLTRPDSWFKPPALLDMASGHVTRLLENGLNDYHSLAWMPDGQIVATQQGLRATIWKFTPDGFSGKITAELWDVAGAQLLEISDKAPRIEASALAERSPDDPHHRRRCACC